MGFCLQSQAHDAARYGQASDLFGLAPSGSQTRGSAMKLLLQAGAGSFCRTTHETFLLGWMLAQQCGVCGREDKQLIRAGRDMHDGADVMFAHRWGMTPK